MIHLIAIVAGFASWILVVVLIGRWILQPIDLASRRSNDRLKFSTADFLALTLIIQIPMVGVRLVTNGNESVPSTILYLFGIGTALLIWFSGVAALCRARIHRGLHRILFVAFVLPMTYYGIFPFATLLAFGIGAWLTGEPDLKWQEILLGFAIEAALFIGFIAAAQITRRISTAAEELDTAQAEPDWTEEGN